MWLNSLCSNQSENAKLISEVGDGPERNKSNRCVEHGLVCDLANDGKGERYHSSYFLLPDLFILPSESESFGFGCFGKRWLQKPMLFRPNTGGIPK